MSEFTVFERHDDEYCVVYRNDRPADLFAWKLVPHAYESALVWVFVASWNRDSLGFVETYGDLAEMREFVMAQPNGLTVFRPQTEEMSK